MCRGTLDAVLGESTASMQVRVLLECCTRGESLAWMHYYVKLLRAMHPICT
jgi:hypothetical protein